MSLPSLVCIFRQITHLHMRKRTETMPTFCNTCWKVLLTVKNMHPPEYQQWRRIACAFEKIHSGVDVLLFCTSMEKFLSMYLFFDLCASAPSMNSEWFSEFVQKSIYYMKSLKLPSTKKKKTKMIQLQIHFAHIFLSPSMTNEIKSGNVKSHIVKAFALGCNFNVLSILFLSFSLCMNILANALSEN